MEQPRKPLGDQEGLTTQPKNGRDLLKADAKKTEKYRQFSLAHLTAYSVYWLTEWGVPTSYENISVLNGRLFPHDFSMQGFPELPDAFRTNRSLLQMRPKYRGFATSDPRKGVYLTEKGKAQAMAVMAAIGPPSFEGHAVPGSTIEVDPRRPSEAKERNRSPARQMEKLRSKILFRKFSEGKIAEAEVVHLLGLVELYDHTLPSELRAVLGQYRKDAEDVGDAEVLAFLDSVGERFRAYIYREDPPPKHSRGL